jgi:hypothetical protein
VAELTDSPPPGGAAAPLEQLSEEELAARDGELSRLEAEVRRRLSPLQAELGAYTAERGRIATERRRRERQAQMRKRQEVRSEVREGAAPSLLEAVSSPEPPAFGERSFSELEFLLETGGVVLLGYPGSKTQTLQMTDGRDTAQVSDLAEARRLYRLGWEFGVPARPGVRVHTPGTRLERLLAAERCFVRPRED